MTRAELAEAVNEYAWRKNGKRCHIDVDTLRRYESGDVRWPGAMYREGLRAVLGAATDAELGFHATPRGRTASGPRPKVAQEPGQLNGEAAASLGPDLVTIGRTLMVYPEATEPAGPSVLLGQSSEAHDKYQQADYGGLAAMLPALLTQVAGLGNGRKAQVVRSHVHLVTAKLLAKIGDPNLAHLAADRAMQAALQSERPELMSTAAFQVACTVLKVRGPEDAEQVSESAFRAARASSPAEVSARGALALISAVAAARRGDPQAATEWLTWSRRLADRLGADANFAWTAFGPTNVRIHEVSVAVDLARPERAIELAAPVDTDALPSGLRSRRGQVHIDSAWAYLQTERYPEAIISLLEAERLAPQTVHHSHRVRGLVTAVAERAGGTAGLRGIAGRVGVTV